MDGLEENILVLILQLQQALVLLQQVVMTVAISIKIELQVLAPVLQVAVMLVMVAIKTAQQLVQALVQPLVADQQQQVQAAALQVEVTCTEIT
jgi:hypothetical protein